MADKRCVILPWKPSQSGISFRLAGLNEELNPLVFLLHLSPILIHNGVDKVRKKGVVMSPE